MQLIMKVSQQKKATKTAGAASRKTASSRTLLKLVKNDEWLAPYTEAIRGRHEQALRKIEELTQCKQTISDFALGHHYFGLHRTRKNWIFREWAPNATRIFLVGDCNDWQEHPDYELQRIEDSGNWELNLPAKALKHGQLYKLHVYWDGGFGERIPSYAAGESGYYTRTIATATYFSVSHTALEYDLDQFTFTMPDTTMHQINFLQRLGQLGSANLEDFAYIFARTRLPDAEPKMKRVFGGLRRVRRALSSSR